MRNSELTGNYGNRKVGRLDLVVDLSQIRDTERTICYLRLNKFSSSFDSSSSSSASSSSGVAISSN
jgi:hypothetical protein